MPSVNTIHRLVRRVPGLEGPTRRLYRRFRARDVRAMYDASYFTGHDERTAGVSGYGTYAREGSNADVAAYLLWRFLPFRRSLDIGCARGFVVECLLELGYDAHGCDISEFAISAADPALRDRLSVLDLTQRRSRRQLRGERYDLVTTLEVLEHLDPLQVPAALRFLRSIASGYVVATIPSLGTNVNGPNGFPNGKVRAEVLDRYLDLGPGYDGPIPYDDLQRDGDGKPLEGHLCIASYEWWASRFERAGFRRVDEIEQAMHPVLGRFDLSASWNLYVFHVADAPAPPAPERTELELARRERQWKLTERQLGPHSKNITRDTVGQHAVDAILEEYEASTVRRPTLLPPA